MFLKENKITFKDKFTTIDIQKLETILTLITLEHPKFSQKREKKKRNEREGEEKRF